MAPCCQCQFILCFSALTAIFDRTIEENGLKKTAAKLQKDLIAFSALALGMPTGPVSARHSGGHRIKTGGRVQTISDSGQYHDVGEHRVFRQGTGKDRPDRQALICRKRRHIPISIAAEFSVLQKNPVYDMGLLWKNNFRAGVFGIPSHSDGWDSEDTPSSRLAAVLRCRSLLPAYRS